MAKLFGRFVGEAGNAIPVDIRENETVGNLTKKFAANAQYAKTADGAWLPSNDPDVVAMRSGAVSGKVQSLLNIQIDPAEEIADVFVPSPQKKQIHVLVVVPEGAGGSESEASKMDQLVEKVDKMYEQTVLGETSEWESISDERGQNIALAEEQQRERYRAYVEINIGDVLTRNRLCVYVVEKEKDSLKAEIPGHDIELIGRTDMNILCDIVLESPLDLGILPRVRLLIEVKRKMKERANSQTWSELIALDVLVDEPVMALLTDLTDHWQFFWVSDTINNHGNIRSVTLRDLSEAFAVIGTLLNQQPTAGAEISLPCFQKPVKRQKLS